MIIAVGSLLYELSVISISLKMEWFVSSSKVEGLDAFDALGAVVVKFVELPRILTAYKRQNSELFGYKD